MVDFWAERGMEGKESRLGFKIQGGGQTLTEAELVSIELATWSVTS